MDINISAVQPAHMQEALVLKRMSEAAYMHDMSTVGIHGGTYWHTDMQTGWMLTKALSMSCMQSTFAHHGTVMFRKAASPHLILAILRLGLLVLAILETGVLLLVGRCSVVLLGVLLPLVPVRRLLLGRHGVVLLLGHLPALPTHMHLRRMSC